MFGSLGCDASNLAMRRSSSSFHRGLTMLVLGAGLLRGFGALDATSSFHSSGCVLRRCVPSPRSVGKDRPQVVQVFIVVPTRSGIKEIFLTGPRMRLGVRPVGHLVGRPQYIPVQDGRGRRPRGSEVTQAWKPGPRCCWCWQRHGIRRISVPLSGGTTRRSQQHVNGATANFLNFS